MEKLFREVKNGIKVAFGQFEEIQSLSINTWCVDYVLMRGDREVLPVFAYRDSRTDAVIPEYLMYRLTGVKAREYTNATTMGMVNVQTGEKAAQIYMHTVHLPRINTIRDAQMVELAEYFGVNYRKDFLNL